MDLNIREISISTVIPSFQATSGLLSWKAPTTLSCYIPPVTRLNPAPFTQARGHWPLELHGITRHSTQLGTLYSPLLTWRFLEHDSIFADRKNMHVWFTAISAKSCSVFPLSPRSVLRTQSLHQGLGWLDPHHIQLIGRDALAKMLTEWPMIGNGNWLN